MNSVRGWKIKMALCIRTEEYAITIGFLLFLMFISWILSIVWARKYNKLLDKMEESQTSKYYKKKK